MSTYHVPLTEWHGHRIAPTTRLGRWAVVLAVVSGIGWLIALPAILFAPTDTGWMPWGILLVAGVVPGFVCAIAASIAAFLAMLRRGERAVSVYLGYVPVACMLVPAAIKGAFFGG